MRKKLGELQFRVLGPVEALSATGPVALGGRPSVNLLAGLLLASGEPVSYGRLTGIVWGDDLPLHPQAALQSLKSRLQRALGGRAIQTGAAGYRVAVSDDTLDLLRFERLMRSADSAMRAGLADDAVRAMDEALARWNLPVLVNVHSDILLRDGVSSLTERYLSAQEKRAALQLELGRYPAVIAELGRLVPAHPFREDLIRLLMLAYYRSHRQADALAAYHRLQRELRDGLGVDPSESLQRLHLDMLRSDVRADQPEGALRPKTPLSLAGESRPPAEQVPHQLPPDADDFSGRGSELAAMLTALGATRGSSTVVISGPGGIGKSALAVHAGHRLSETFPDGQVYLDAGAAGIQPGSPADLAADLLRAFGVTGPGLPATMAARVDQYRSLVASRRFLLILDNVASEAQVRDLLPSGPGCAAIICARRRLTGFPGALLVDLEVLSEQDAVGFLSQIVGPGRLSREPGPAAELIRLCGGMPLALRAAGARLAAKPHWDVADLVRRLADERCRLDELTYGDLNVRSTISSSYAGVSPDAQEMLGRLAALELPDIPLWAAAALAGGRRTEEEGADLCEVLVDARLLEASDSPSGPQYRLHGLIRAYARQVAAGREATADGDNTALACARAR